MAALGKGQATAQKGLEGLRKGGVVQDLGHLRQGCPVPRLTAKGQSGGPGSVEDFHTAPGEGLSGGGGPHRGQLQDEVCATLQGHPGPGPLVGDGAVPPLDKIPAHGTHHGPRPCQSSGLGDLVSVPVVEGVILCHDAHNFHASSPPRVYFYTYLTKLSEKPLLIPISGIIINAVFIVLYFRSGRKYNFILHNMKECQS